MTDAQLHVRLINKRMIIVAIILILISAGLFYYRFSTQSDVDGYKAQKAQEASLQASVTDLQAQSASKMSTIEQTGKELVSFSEDKLKYIVLASQLSDTYGVSIGKLTVSDVWTEGQMAGMTADIELEGTLANLTAFINEYCNIKYTNRINIVSLRPVDRFAWVTRGVDGQKVLGWFDLSQEEYLYAEKLRKQLEELSQAAAAAGVNLSDLGIDITANPSTEEIQAALEAIAIIASTGVTPDDSPVSPDNPADSNPLEGLPSDTENGEPTLPVEDEEPSTPTTSENNSQDSGSVNTVFGSGGTVITPASMRAGSVVLPRFTTPGSGYVFSRLSATTAETEDTANDSEEESETDEDDNADTDSPDETGGEGTTVLDTAPANPWAGEPTEVFGEDEPITLRQMFSPKIYKLYIEVDFLGRQ